MLRPVEQRRAEERRASASPPRCRPSGHVVDVPEEVRGRRPSRRRAPLRLRAAADAPCASPSSPTSTLTCPRSRRSPRRSSARRPTRSGASATSSATARSRTSAARGRPEHAAVCLAGNHDLGVLGTLDLDDFRGDAAAAATWTRACSTPTRARTSSALAVERERDGVGLYHAQPARPGLGVRPVVGGGARRDPRLRHRRHLVGHSHVPLAIADERRASTAATRRAGTEIELGRRALAAQPGLGRPAARRRPAGGLAAARPRRRPRLVPARRVRRRADAGRRSGRRACRERSPSGWRRAAGRERSGELAASGTGMLPARRRSSLGRASGPARAEGDALAGERELRPPRAPCRSAT